MNDISTPIDEYIVTYAGEHRGGVGKDVAFNRKSFGDGQPENPDQGYLYTGTDGLRVELVQDFDEEALQKLFSFSINASRGVDPENPPEPTDWEELMKGGLQTSLEDIRIAFACYGVSRTATHQLVRSRRAAFHQQSQRAHYYGNKPSVRMPESYLNDELVMGAYLDLVEHASYFYEFACKRDISYQDARFGLLEGTANFILCEYSLREFIDVYAYRACSMFQWEIVTIMREMKRVLVEQHTWLENYVKITCERTTGAKDAPPHSNAIELGDSEEFDHTCMFQGWESVEGQCDFPWARESNRQFRSDAHRIENTNK